MLEKALKKEVKKIFYLKIKPWVFLANLHFDQNNFQKVFI